MPLRTIKAGAAYFKFVLYDAGCAAGGTAVPNDL